MASESELRLLIRTIADDKGIRDTRSSVGDLGKSFDLTGASALKLGGALVGVSGAFALIEKGAGALASAAAGALQTSLQFGAAMASVGAVSGASAAQLAELSNLARTSGKDLGIGAVEGAKGLAELVKGGVSTQAALGGALKSTELLAKAGGVDLATAAEISATALNSFGLSAADLAKVADLVAGAANASSIGVDDFRQSLTQAGAVARTIGVSFDDTAVAIAELGQAGIKGSDAGTSLRTFLLSLTPSSQQASDELTRLGIVTANGANKFFDASGKAKSLAEVSQVLKTATAGYTDQQRLATLQVIFGTDALRAASIFARNGADGFDTLAKSMAKVSATDVASKQVNSLQGDLDKLKAAADAAGISLEKSLDPTLRFGAHVATRALDPTDREAAERQRVLDTVGGIVRLNPIAVLQAQGKFANTIRARPVGLDPTGAPLNAESDLRGVVQSQLVAEATATQAKLSAVALDALSRATAATNVGLLRTHTTLQQIIQDLGDVAAKSGSLSTILNALSPSDTGTRAAIAAAQDLLKIDQQVLATRAAARVEEDLQREREASKISDPRDAAGAIAARQRVQLLDDLLPKERALADAQQAQNDLAQQAIALTARQAQASLAALPAREKLDDTQAAIQRARLVAADRTDFDSATRTAARRQARDLSRTVLPGQELAAFDADRSLVSGSRAATRNQLNADVVAGLTAKAQQAINLTVNPTVNLTVEAGPGGFDEGAVIQKSLDALTAAIHDARIKAEGAASSSLTGNRG